MYIQNMSLLPEPDLPHTSSKILESKKVEDSRPSLCRSSATSKLQIFSTRHDPLSYFTLGSLRLLPFLSFFHEDCTGATLVLGIQFSARKDLLSYVHDHHHLSCLFLSLLMLLHRQKEFGIFSATSELGICWSS